jgi:DNA-binding MarR family transcriptional regulator
MDRTTLTRNIAPLARRGLVRTRRDPADARLRMVALTRRGQRMIETAFPLWQEAQERVRRLTEQEREPIREGLERALSSVAGRRG